MNRTNKKWWLALVIVLLVWSFMQMNPPVGRNLATIFEEQAAAARRDATFTNIVEKLHKLEQADPQRTFANLVDAVDTNDIVKYFPQLLEKYETVINNDPNPSRAVLNILQRNNAGKIKLGLDLQGGTSFLVGVRSNYLANGTNIPATEERQRQAIANAVEVLRKRVDKLGVAEPVIVPEGADRILVQLPGLSDAAIKEARANIQKAAFLELRLVDPDSDDNYVKGLSEPGYEFLREKTPHTYERDRSRMIPGYYVKTKVEMTGKYIKFATWNRDTVGKPKVEFKLDSEGSEIFGKLTRENVGRQMAIVLDGELQSAPTIKGAIEGGSCEITGSYTEEEAQSLATALENPLQVPLEVKSEYSVSPTLGRDTVKSGVTSAIAGTLAVALFMICYYFLAGVVADIALVTNIIILLGVMCALPSTFTLPGIAGIVLTIGMAVDANVLIFERIREESAKGKSLRGALAAGYDRAFGTIFDSHVTTLISSIILWAMGTGPIKGFGVTLTIGVAASLFTALVVTRLIFDFLIGKGVIKKLDMLHIIRNTKLDFMKIAKPAFFCTWSLIALALCYGWLGRGAKMYGTEFAGGDEITLTFKAKVEQKALTDAIARDAGVKEPTIQYQKDFSTGTELLRITSPTDTAAKVLGAVQNNFGAAGFELKGQSHVGPTIGAEIKRTAVVASLLSLLGILFYVAMRYELIFAVGAVIAVIHDVLMTIGCYCLTGLLHPGGEGRQFNATMVAAVLTIIGFSINDTIVIFDRIREDLKLGVRGSFRDIINQALNQTLSRTIITSGTVFLATMSLYIFGGGAINDFAFTFLVGIITGTYSSIYVASFIVLWWQNYRHAGARPKLGASTVTMDNAVTARP